MKLPQEIDRLAEFLETKVGLIDFSIEGSTLSISALSVGSSHVWEELLPFIDPTQNHCMFLIQQYLQITALDNILIRRQDDRYSLYDLMRAVGSQYPHKIYKRTPFEFELGLFLGNPSPTPLVTVDQWLSFVPSFRKEYPMKQRRLDAINAALGVIDHDSLPKHQAIAPTVGIAATESGKKPEINDGKLIFPELENASIRSDGDLFSVYDFLKLVGQSANPRKAWTRILERYSASVAECYTHKFPYCKGGAAQPTPATNREGLIKIAQVLPGEFGTKFRSAAADIILKYLDADITLADEVVDRAIKKGKVEDAAHHAVRTQGKVARTQLMGECAKRGVTGQGFADVTNAGYLGLFGDSAKGIRKERGLPVKSNLRENLNSDELTDVLFMERLAKKRLAEQKAKGNEQCTNVVYIAAQAVAELVN